MNQSEFLTITCNLPKAREKSRRVQGTSAFGFVFHWLQNWREIFKPMTRKSNRQCLLISTVIWKMLCEDVASKHQSLISLRGSLFYYSKCYFLWSKSGLTVVKIVKNSRLRSLSRLTFSFLLRKETDVTICNFHKVAFLFFGFTVFPFYFLPQFSNLFNGKSCAVTENRETQPLGVRIFKYVKTESIKHNLLSKMVQVLLHPHWTSRLELCRDTLFLSFVKMNVKASANSN